MTQDYKSETRHAYQGAKVDSYLRHTSGLRWARFTMWRELRVVRQAFLHFGIPDGECILDAPCGTGIAATVLKEHAHIGVDISREMMARLPTSYTAPPSVGFVQADLTQLPLADGAVCGAIVLGFMHRVPSEIRVESLREVHRVSKRFAAISFTVDDRLQRLKRKFVKFLRLN